MAFRSTRAMQPRSERRPNEPQRTGASLARAAGFHTAKSVTVEAAPTWKGLVGTAEARNASLIVVGSHRHGGLIGHVAGNIASAVVTHVKCDVLLVHPRTS